MRGVEWNSKLQGGYVAISLHICNQSPAALLVTSAPLGHRLNLAIFHPHSSFHYFHLCPAIDRKTLPPRARHWTAARLTDKLRLEDRIDEYAVAHDRLVPHGVNGLNNVEHYVPVSLLWIRRPLDGRPRDRC